MNNEDSAARTVTEKHCHPKHLLMQRDVTKVLKKRKKTDQH